MVKSFIVCKSLTLFILIIFPYLILLTCGERLSTNIFRADYYLFWIIGCMCWLHVVFNHVKFNWVAKISLLGFSYVFLLCVFKCRHDANSTYAFFTLICGVGTVLYLQTVTLASFHIFLTAGIAIPYFIQLCIGYVQGVSNNWYGLGITGGLYNSGFFANYLASLIPLSLSGFLNHRFRKVTRIGFMVIFFAEVILMVATVARAAIIGTVLGILFVAVSCHEKIKIKWFFLFGILVAVLCGIFLYKLKPESASGRLTIYGVAVNIVKDHPLIGIGPNRFSAVYNNYQSDFFKTEQPRIRTQLLADNTFEAFNSVIQVLVEYGLIGLLLLGTIAYLVFRKISTAKPPVEKEWMSRGSCGCIVSIIVASLFSNPFHLTPILLIFCFHVSVILSQKTQSSIVPSKRNCLPLVAATFFTLFIVPYVLVQYNAEKKWKMAAELAVYDNFNKAQKFYADAYPFLKTNGDFLYNYGAEAYLAGNYSLAINLLTQATHYTSFSNLYVYLGDAYAATAQYEFAEKNYLHAIYMVPSHTFPKFQLIQLYKKWQKPEQARSWTIKTLNYPVKVRSEFVRQLVAELKKDM